MADIYLIEMSALNTATSTVETLRWCTGLGFITAPSDTPANTPYYPIILQPGLMKVTCFSERTTSGQNVMTRGEITGINIDSDLDYLHGYDFAGRSCTIRRGPETGAYPAAFPILETHVMEQPDFNFEEAVFPLRDKSKLLDITLQSTKYAGSNVLPAGVEGTSDLAGRVKPLGYGTCKNVTPPCVNTSKLIYQVNDGAILTTGRAVRDKGVVLTAGSDYSSQADMEANAPAAGQVRWYPAGGYFRLGSAAAGQITADFVVGATSANRTTAQIVKTIMLRTGSAITAGEISSADVTALDTDNGAEIGIWINEDRQRRDIVSALLDGVGAWWGADQFGIFRMQRWEVPALEYNLVDDNQYRAWYPDVDAAVIAGTYPNGLAHYINNGMAEGRTWPGLAVLDYNNIEDSVQRSSSRDAGNGVPAGKVIVNYDKNNTVQKDSDLAGAVTTSDRNWLSEEYRKVSISISQPLVVSPPELTYISHFVNEADATAEANRRATLYGTERTFYTCNLIDPELFSQIIQGGLVVLKIPRFELDNGKLFRIAGYQPDYESDQIELTLWG